MREEIIGQKDDNQRALKIKMRGTCSGVYKITTPNGRIYIGSSVNIRRRAHKHRYGLKHGQHGNCKLQRSFDKYGVLVLEQIHKCPKEDLEKWEQFFIDKLKPSLNIRKVASSNLGLRHSDETKAKLKELAKKKDFKWLKKHHFKTGADNPMKKGAFMRCHEANAIQVIARKEGFEPKRYKSIARAARVFHVNEALIRRRVSGQVMKSLGGWMFESVGLE